MENAEIGDPNGARIESVSEISSAAPRSSVPRRHAPLVWLPAVLTGLLVVIVLIVAVWYWLDSSRKYVRALVYVPEENPYVLFPGTSRQDYESFKRTQIALITSRTVLNAALHQPKVASLSIVKGKSDAVAWLERELVADYSQGPETLTLTLAGDNEQETAEVVNAVVSAYLNQSVEREQESRARRSEELKGLRMNYALKLRDKRKVLTDLLESIGPKDSNNLPLKQRIALDALAAAQKDLIQVQSEIRTLQVDLSLQGNRGKNADAEAIPETAMNEELQKDPLVQISAQRIGQLRAELIKIMDAKPEKHEELCAALRKDIESEEKVAAVRSAKIRPAAEARIRDRLRGELRLQEQQKKQRLEYLNSLQTRLDEDMKRLDNETRRVSRSSLDLETIQEEIAESNEILKRIGRELETEYVEAKAPPRIRLLQEAVIFQPEDRQLIRVLLGTLLGGGLILVLLGLGLWGLSRVRTGKCEAAISD